MVSTWNLIHENKQANCQKSSYAWRLTKPHLCSLLLKICPCRSLSVINDKKMGLNLESVYHKVLINTNLPEKKLTTFPPHHIPLWHVRIQCPYHFCNNRVINVFCQSPWIYALSSFWTRGMCLLWCTVELTHTMTLTWGRPLNSFFESCRMKVSL